MVPYYITDERFNTYDDDDPPRFAAGGFIISFTTPRVRVCLRRFRARRVPAINVVCTVKREHAGTLALESAPRRLRETAVRETLILFDADGDARVPEVAAERHDDAAPVLRVAAAAE